MRITEAQLRRIVRESLLSEQVFGAQAFVYHGSLTPPEEFARIIEEDSFDPGGAGGDMYGKGLYTVYEADPGTNTFRGDYGNHIYKLKVSLSGFLIFDPEVAQKVLGGWVGISEQLRRMGLQSVWRQIEKKLGLAKSRRLEAPPEDFTSNAANSVSELVSPHVRGIVFTGRRDGPVAVIYDPASVLLVAHKEAGSKEWQPMKPSRDSVSRSASLSFTPGKYNYPAGRSTKTVEIIKAAIEGAGLTWDDWHGDNILEANEGLDKLRAANPKAWEKEVTNYIEFMTRYYDGDMPEEEHEERTRQAVKIALAAKNKI